MYNRIQNSHCDQFEAEESKFAMCSRLQLRKCFKSSTVIFTCQVKYRFPLGKISPPQRCNSKHLIKLLLTSKFGMLKELWLALLRNNANNSWSSTDGICHSH